MKSRMIICLFTVLFLDNSSPAYGAMDHVTEVTAAIEAGLIKAKVPLNCTFYINPSVEGIDAFFSSNIVITNMSAFPLIVEAVSLKAYKENPLKVIDESTYTDLEWDRLGRGDASTQIALGFDDLLVQSKKNGDKERSGFYFPDEAKQERPIELYTLGIEDIGSMKLQAKFGRSFAESIASNYECILKFKMKE